MIAQFCLSKAKGGLELCALNLAEDFARDAADSVVICRESSFIEQNARERGLKTFSIKPRGTYFSLKASLKLRRFLRENKIKAVFVHNLRDLWILYPATLGLNLEVIGFAHMFVKNVNKKDFFHRLIYSQLKHLIALTGLQKTELLKCLPVPEEKYVLIPNGVDTQKFVPGPKPPELFKSWGLNAEDRVIGYVGRLDPQKGVFELVDAFASLKDVPHLKFIMIGDDTLPSQPTKKKLEARIEELNFGDRLRLLPFTPEVHKLMRGFDVFIMPSYEETFGLVLIEAMSTGLPCIATDAGGPPEILEWGELGLLVPAKQASPLAEALRDLLNSPEKRQRLSENARKKAVEYYDGQLVFTKIKSLLNN